jgi:hypothetical protein
MTKAILVTGSLSDVGENSFDNKLQAALKQVGAADQLIDIKLSSCAVSNSVHVSALILYTTR